MDKVRVRPIMHPHTPIEVSPAEAAILRARGLLVDDKPTAQAAPKKTTAAGAKAKAETEGNIPS